ncbi:MAG TPA: hypothetical protein VN207_12965 [Ktedonobacteraceae bacterium]|nr:hypothetical protein [Ktedonobacteraceae bacterium]
MTQKMALYNDHRENREEPRRIVRYKVKEQAGQPLSSEELRTILCDQIVGIEINEEAIRIAAFGLYLAILHYQSPRNILESRPLPNLIYQKDQERNKQYYQILFAQMHSL